MAGPTGQLLDRLGHLVKAARRPVHHAAPVAQVQGIDLRRHLAERPVSLNRQCMHVRAIAGQDVETLA